jgi:hypothetical protein
MIIRCKATFLSPRLASSNLHPQLAAVGFILTPLGGASEVSVTDRGMRGPKATTPQLRAYKFVSSL